MRWRKYPDDPWFFCISEGSEISHLLEAANSSVSQRFDLLDQVADLAEEILEAHERRLAKEAALKVAERAD